MTKSQKLVLWLAVLVLAVLCLFPPVVLYVQPDPLELFGVSPRFPPYSVSVGFQPVWASEGHASRLYADGTHQGTVAVFGIDWAKLSLCAVVVTLLAGMTVYSLAPARP